MRIDMGTGNMAKEAAEANAEQGAAALPAFYAKIKREAPRREVRLQGFHPVPDGVQLGQVCFSQLLALRCQLLLHQVKASHKLVGRFF